jgi:uncharacterized protein (TIGR00730 family)
MNITVFGGSEPRPGEEPYADALRLGLLLAQAGHCVLTGGYIGTMEAVSRGAAEAGGHVIGVTCDQIEAWRPVRPNQWVREERRFATVRLRLFALIEDCDAAIALPGGVGTLAEVAEMWSHLQTGAISPRPLILVGPGWRSTMETFLRYFDRYVPERYRDLLIFAPTVEIAVQILAGYPKSS